MHDKGKRRPATSVPSEDVRLSSQARAALDESGRLIVTRYGQPAGAYLTWDRYALIEPMLDLLEEGVVLSPELLMTKDDIALIADLGTDDEPTPAEDAVMADMLGDRSA